MYLLWFASFLDEVLFTHCSRFVCKLRYNNEQQTYLEDNYTCNLLMCLPGFGPLNSNTPSKLKMESKCNKLKIQSVSGKLCVYVLIFLED